MCCVMCYQALIETVNSLETKSNILGIQFSAGALRPSKISAVYHNFVYFGGASSLVSPALL